MKDISDDRLKWLVEYSFERDAQVCFAHVRYRCAACKELVAIAGELLNARQQLKTLESTVTTWLARVVQEELAKERKRVDWFLARAYASSGGGALYTRHDLDSIMEFEANLSKGVKND